MTSSQLLVHPSKLWDITLQMSYVGARWLQNRIHSRAILSKCGGDAEISEICDFLSNGLCELGFLSSGALITQ